MPITQDDRLAAAQAASTGEKLQGAFGSVPALARSVAGPSVADKKAEAARMTGQNYGEWKMDPEKGWVREAKQGGVTIYEPWSGPYGSSPLNPKGPSDKQIMDPAASPNPNNKGLVGSILSTVLAPVGFVGETLAQNRKALGR